MNNKAKNLTGFTPLNPARPVRLNRNLMGFTLIELLVSITIIAAMSGLFMVNYHNTNKRSELGVTKQKLASDIRIAQNNSLGSKEYESNKTPGGGWGVHFDLADPAHYMIFADKNLPNGNQAYDAGETMETKTLPIGVTINSLSPVVGGKLDIVFFPPDPVTYINGEKNKIAEITLKEGVNNSMATTTVNFFGLIDSE
jgi:prepilin-type N-terminal cleavage/methylation domain-containing protein